MNIPGTAAAVTGTHKNYMPRAGLAPSGIGIDGTARGARQQTRG